VNGEYLYLLLFVAPIAQILFSAQRINNKTRLPIIAIAAIVFVSGIAFYILAGFLYLKLQPPGHHLGPHSGPGATGVYLVLLGIIGNCITTPIIALISYIVWLHKQEKVTL
jgi:hypothetical protein